jgi:hypothetical protein
MSRTCPEFKLKKPNDSEYVPSSFAYQPSRKGATGSPVGGTGESGILMPFPNRELFGFWAIKAGTAIKKVNMRTTPIRTL